MNLLSDIPDYFSEELITVLAESKCVRIERIVSDGHASPEGFWYDQKQGEWISLVSGSAVLSVEKGSEVEHVELKPGDHLLIPAHCRHRVESTSAREKTVWLAVHFS